MASRSVWGRLGYGDVVRHTMISDLNMRDGQDDVLS